jgi:hypothetical protein
VLDACARTRCSPTNSKGAFRYRIGLGFRHAEILRSISITYMLAVLSCPARHFGYAIAAKIGRFFD